MTRPTTACLAACLALIGSATPARSSSLRDRVRRLAENNLEYRCLTPAVEGVFNQAVESGAFRVALGPSFGITDASAHDHRIELTVGKPGSAVHTITLDLERIVGRAPDGRAGAFVFYLQAGTDAESSRVLLGIARVLAERVPDTAFAPCRSREEGFGTRTVALASAAFAVLVIVAALLVGFAKLRRPLAT